MYFLVDFFFYIRFVKIIPEKNLLFKNFGYHNNNTSLISAVYNFTPIFYVHCFQILCEFNSPSLCESAVYFEVFIQTLLSVDHLFFILEYGLTKLFAGSLFTVFPAFSYYVSFVSFPFSVENRASKLPPYLTFKCLRLPFHCSRHRPCFTSICQGRSDKCQIQSNFLSPR